MGFTGAKALEWKFRYSDAFAAMEAEITNRQTLRIPTTITEALELALEQSRRATLRKNPIKTGIAIPAFWNHRPETRATPQRKRELTYGNGN